MKTIFWIWQLSTETPTVPACHSEDENFCNARYSLRVLFVLIGIGKLSRASHARTYSKWELWKAHVFVFIGNSEVVGIHGNVWIQMKSFQVVHNTFWQQCIWVWTGESIKNLEFTTICRLSYCTSTIILQNIYSNKDLLFSITTQYCNQMC